MANEINRRVDQNQEKTTLASGDLFIVADSENTVTVDGTSRPVLKKISTDNLKSAIAALSQNSFNVSIEFPEDGTVAPAAAEVYSNANKEVRIRKFSGTADNDVTFDFSTPYEMDATEPVQFRVKGVITEATGPSSEGIVFAMQGYGSADDEASSKTFGTQVSVTKSSMSHAQNDVWLTEWSGDVTITDITNDTLNQISFSRLATDSGDTYAQDIGVIEIEIRYIKR